MAEHLAFAVNAEGLGLAPFDAWLVLRGLKTLGVRLDRECASAGTLARALADALGPGRVLYPELAGHPGREVHRRQARGGGSVLAFLAGTAERARAVVDRTRLFTTAVSFGNTSSSIGLPCAMSHASVPTGSRHVGGLRPDLVRLSVGLEDPGDLLEDLRQALPAACGAR